ncbi:hypothetical protein Tco_1155154 [Tanacetum coccineum]
MSQDIMNIVATSCAVNESMNMSNCLANKCYKCLELKAEPFKQNDMIEKDAYNKLLKDFSSLEKHCISVELSQQLTQQNFQNQTSCANQNAPAFLEFCQINDLKAQLQAKITTISKLKAKIHALNFESAREINPLDSDLDSACKHVTQIQELLVYVTKNCPSANKVSEKLVAVTPVNKTKKVRFTEPVTSSNNTNTPVDSLNRQDYNNLLFRCIGVIRSTSASGSKPQGTTKKNRISRPPSSN